MILIWGMCMKHSRCAKLHHGGWHNGIQDNCLFHWQFHWMIPSMRNFYKIQLLNSQKPFVTYLNRYLCIPSWLTLSTFMWAWYFTTKSTLWGTTNLLSMLIPFQFTTIPLLGRAYWAKPFSVIVGVFSQNSLGLNLEHLLSDIHGEFGFRAPQGPWIIKKKLPHILLDQLLDLAIEQR